MEVRINRDGDTMSVYVKSTDYIELHFHEPGAASATHRIPADRLFALLQSAPKVSPKDFMKSAGVNLVP